MGYFLKRYISWYVWLAVYCTAIGGLVGVACFVPVALPLVVLTLPFILPVGIAYAAPLNFLILPVAFHCLRNSERRRRYLVVAGLVGGFVSPGLVVLGVSLLDLPDNSQIGKSLLLPMRWGETVGLLVFSSVGAIAGVVCAMLYDKHGDKPSPFDVNASLEAVRKGNKTSVK